jgi:hypothetical protein
MDTGTTAAEPELEVWPPAGTTGVNCCGDFLRKGLGGKTQIIGAQ